MNQLLEWAPLIVFFAAFKLLDLYWATAVLMAACVLQALAHRAYAGTYKTMHLVTTCVVLVLGTATLVLHDKRFIQWKPTVLLGLTAGAFLASMLIGRRPLARRMFESVFDQPLDIAMRTWSLLNVLWAAWFAALALLNIYVARNFSETVWVNFKVFGITAASILFMIPQAMWMSGKARPAPAEQS